MGTQAYLPLARYAFLYPDYHVQHTIMYMIHVIESFFVGYVKIARLKFVPLINVPFW